MLKNLALKNPEFQIRIFLTISFGLKTLNSFQLQKIIVWIKEIDLSSGTMKRFCPIIVIIRRSER